jgi:hypothetical protein
MHMRSLVWPAAVLFTLPGGGCSGVEVDVLSRRTSVDMADPPTLMPSDPPDLGRPPPPRCTSRRQGDGRNCQSATLWKLSAQLDCRSRGERLDVLMPFDPCASDRFRFVSYMCCSGGTMPPGPGPMLGQPPAPRADALGPIDHDHDPSCHGGAGN